MAAPTKRVVGWYDRREWEEVYHELYSHDLLLQRHAVDRIAVWKCRMMHKLSTAIECTWQLVTASLQYEHACQRGTARAKDQDIRMAYSMAVIRFVNLLTEKNQTRVFAQPINHLARQLGLPDWLVDLRHDATHAALPSLHILREAAAFALDWLQREYWEAERSCDPEDHGPDTTEGSDSGLSPTELPTRPSESVLSQLLLDLMAEQQTIKIDEDEDAADNDTLRHILSRLEEAAQTWPHQLIEILLRDGYLIPTERQLLMKAIDRSNVMESLDPYVPDAWLQLWLPLLTVLHSLDLTPLLLQRLMLGATEQASVRNRFMCGWAGEIMRAIKSVGELTSRKRWKGRPKRLKYNTPCQVNGRVLLDLALKRPNCFTTTLIPRLCPLVYPPLSQAQQQNLINLVQGYTNLTSSDGQDESDLLNIFSMTDIRKQFGHLAVDAESQMNGCHGNGTPQKKRPWGLSSDLIDWSCYPIGICPNREVTPSNLQLPESVNHIQNSGRHGDRGPGHGLYQDSLLPELAEDVPQPMDSGADWQSAGDVSTSPTREPSIDQSRFQRLKEELTLL